LNPAFLAFTAFLSHVTLLAASWLVSLPLHAWRRSSLPLAALVNVFALAGSAAAGVAGAFGLGLPEPLRWQAPVSAPWLELPVRLDPLSAFFLLAMAAQAVPVSLYSFGYIRYGAYGQSPVWRSGLLSALLGALTLIFSAGGVPGSKRFPWQALPPRCWPPDGWPSG
jgi:formate hydrogenlyase subunit 3/multisubunit Na+/H+ antiporter MnhD subunit